MKSEACPACGSGRHKKNGHIHNGKLNRLNKDCGRQCVADCEFKTIGEEVRESIKRALERNSPRGICRIFKVSPTWLPGFIASLYDTLPADLGISLPSFELSDSAVVHMLTIKGGEIWSFAAKKSDKQWICIALDAKTRHVIAFHVGDRSKNSARQLWDKIPDAYRKHATFNTDLYDSYVGIIPEQQHRRAIKQTGLSYSVERFNCAMRQRVSRLVRDSPAFSKKSTNHIGAIRCFICHYNQTRNTAALRPKHHQIIRILCLYRDHLQRRNFRRLPHAPGESADCRFVIGSTG